MVDREAWLKLTHEDPIEPGLPICDPHHHLWDYPDDLPENRVPGFTRHVRHYLLKEILDDARGHNKWLCKILPKLKEINRRPATQGEVVAPFEI